MQRSVSPSGMAGNILLVIGRLRTLSSNLKLRNFDPMEIRQCKCLQVGVMTALRLDAEQV